MVEQWNSCQPFYDTIKRHGKKVKWNCDTAGFHEYEAGTIEEAKKIVDQLKARSIACNWLEWMNK